MHTACIPASAAGQRFDRTLAALFDDYSRSCLQQWIRDGRVLLDGTIASPRHKLRGGERVELRPPEPAGGGDVAAQPIPLLVLHEDADIAVIDKPAGLVMHPAAGNPDGTVQNALLHRYPEAAAVPRAGIVHRLDKDTSGLFVVARTLAAHKSLVAQLAARTVSREYRAVCLGVPVAGERIAAPIGRHPVDRKRMAVVANGREAISRYRVLERFAAHALLAVALETGRTHQIRVHLSHRQHPLVGDPVYAGRLRIPAGCSDALRAALRQFPRQALHAAELKLQHPRSGASMRFSAPLPDDFQALLTALRADGDGRAAGAAR